MKSGSLLTLVVVVVVGEADHDLSGISEPPIGVCLAETGVELTWLAVRCASGRFGCRAEASRDVGGSGRFLCSSIQADF
jgi:hypothetical protein